MKKNNIKIILENGIVMPCKSFGYKKDIFGSFIFNTSIVGYEETLTDPSYKSEILVMTFPAQGIYGINNLDQESSKIHMSALIVNNYEENYSNNHAVKSLDKFLKEQETLGVYDVDTRYLTQLIRDKGSMRGAIVDIESNSEEIVNKVKSLVLEDQVKNVSPKKITIMNPKAKKTIVFYDFGAKENIKKILILNGYKLIIVPFDTNATKVLSYKPEFVFLSNGPGDPAKLTSVVTEIKKLIAKKVKIVGICLGHQLLGLAVNAKTERLKFGHHATNHPVIDLENDKVYITSQNHNYAVKEDTLPKTVEPLLRSLNDHSLEGMKSNKYHFISTQFHPEAAPGTNDANLMFERFIEFKGDK